MGVLFGQRHLDCPVGRKNCQVVQEMGDYLPTLGGPVRISQGRHSLCGQEPHSPRNCSWALIKSWVPREAEMFCLFYQTPIVLLGAA